MKKGLKVFFILLAAGAVGCGTYYQFVYKNNISKSDGRVSSTDENAVPVESVKKIAGIDSAAGNVERFAGVVEAQSTWSAKIEGEKSVKETYVQEGDLVKKGDKLFSYNTSEDEDKLAQDQIDLERYENSITTSNATIAQLNKERATLTSQDDLLKNQTDILQEENEIKQNEYEIKAKKIEMQSLQDSIKDSVVTSQLDGIVKTINEASASSSSSVSVNSDSNSDAYITIMAVGNYRVKGTVNEQNYSSISEGMNMIIFSRVNDSTWTGTVTEIKNTEGTSTASSDDYSSSSSSDSTSTNYPFYVELDNSDGLMLGQHVYMEEDVGQTEQKDGIWIPDYYINKTDDGAAWVWAASENNTLEKREVETGDYDEDTMEYQILSGIGVDDYIRAYDSQIEEGDPVTYIDYSGNDENMDSYEYADESEESWLSETEYVDNSDTDFVEEGADDALED